MVTQELITYGGWIVGSACGLYQVFLYQNRQWRKDNDETASSLIDKLKEKAVLQEDEMKSMRTSEKERDKLIAGLQGQVKTLTEILQGRDPEMKIFLQQVPSLCEKVNESLEISKSNAESMSKLTDAITSLVATIKPTK